MSRVRKKKTSSGGGSFLKSVLTGSFTGLGIFLISAVVVVFVGWNALNRFLRSDQLREIIAAESSKGLKSQVQMAPITWENSTAFTDTYEAQGFEDAAFRQLKLDGFRVNLDLSRENFRRRVWEVEDVKVNQLQVIFGEEGRLEGNWTPEAVGDALPERPEESATPDGQELLVVDSTDEDIRGSVVIETAEEGDGGDFISGLLPNEVEIGRILVQSTNLYFDGEQDVKATGIEALVTPTSAEDTWKIEARGGSVLVENTDKRDLQVPKIEIDAINFTTNWEQYYISSAQLRLPSDAIMTLDGHLDFEGEGDMQLQTQITHLDSQEVLMEDWKQRLKGKLTLDATVTGSPLDMPSTVQKGTIRLDNAVIEALPVLEQLAKYTQSDRFRRIALNEASMDFERQGELLILRNLALQSDGLARLEGEIVVQGEQLAGKLNLGVVPGTLKWIPGAERKVFTENRDGYLWTVVNLTGTTDKPQQDLAARLQQGAIESTIESLQKGDTKELENAARQILGNPETADKVMDILNGFFK